MPSMQQVLTFFNMTDREGNLSITNIAMIVLIAKIALAPAVSIAEVAAFFIALLNYSHKRYEASKAANAEVVTIDESRAAVSEMATKLTEIESKVTGILLATGFKK